MRQKPRPVELSEEVAQEVSATFGLGSMRAVWLAGRGWASLNVVWQMATTSATWAIKEVSRESVEQLEASAEIEQAAFDGGVACLPIVRTAQGTVTVSVTGRVFRCHPFVDDEADLDELTTQDASSAGHALGLLHSWRSRGIRS